MHFLKAGLALAAIKTVNCHSVFTTLFINDLNQGDGTCIRMPTNPSTCTAPIINLASNDMACGVDGDVGVSRVCSAPQGSKLSFLWREFADASQPGAIDVSHKGPCAVYMKAVSSAITDPGTGNGWFKIWDDGYDSTTSQWCTEKLMANGGLFSVDVPSDLAGGYYLVRPELLSLHQADKKPSQPQFYTGCAQIFLQSSSTANPSNVVSIPGYVNADDPSMIFNIYEPKFPYPMPGPSPYTGGGSSTNLKLVTTSLTQKDGLQPAGCILNNANWCGLEVASYSTEAGCWSASQACWDQATSCYTTAPPTGSKNCKIWESKCTAIQSACNAGNFNGPPDSGRNLNPTLALYKIPDAGDTAGEASQSVISLIPIPFPTFSIVNLPTESSLHPIPSDIAFSTITLAIPDAFSTAGAESVTNTLLFPSLATSIATSIATIIPIPTAIAQPSFGTQIPSPTSGFHIPIPLSISDDATCGGTTRKTCLGSPFGQCCSKWGWCGNTDEYCVADCQSVFGNCGYGGGKKRFTHRHVRHGR